MSIFRADYKFHFTLLLQFYLKVKSKMLCWSWLPCQSWRKLRLMEEVTYAPHQGWCNSCYEWRYIRSKQEIMTCLRGVLRHLICQKLSILIYCKCFKLLEVFKAVYRYFCLLPCSVFIQYFLVEMSTFSPDSVSELQE